MASKGVEGYLPPVVTEFIADISRLATGVAAAKTLVHDYVTSTNDRMSAAGADAGRGWVTAFNDQMRFRVLDGASGSGGEGARGFAEAGKRAGMMFAGSFSSVLWPVLIALLIMSTPALGAAIAGIVSLGLSLGFIGLGAFVLRTEKGLIDAAGRFKDTVGGVFRTAAAPMLAPMIRGLDIIGKAFVAIGPSLNRSFEALARGIEPLATGVAGFITIVMPALEKVLVDGGPIEAFAAALPVIAVGVANFLTSIAENGPGIVAFINDAGVGVSNLFTGLGIVVGALTATYKWLHDLHSQAIAQGWDTPWNAIQNGIGFVVGTAVSAGKSVWQWVTSLPGKVRAGVAALPGILRQAATAAFDQFFFAVGFGAGKVVSFFTVTLPGQVRAGITFMWDMAERLFHAGVAKAVFAVTTLPGQIADWLARTADRVRVWAVQAPDMLYQAGKDLVLGLIRGIGSMIDSAVGAIGNLAERIKLKFKEGLQASSPSRVFAQYGLWTVQGYVQGIQSSLGLIGRAWQPMLSPAGGPGFGPEFRPPPPPPPGPGAGGGGGGGGPMMVHTTINIDGQKVLTALTPAAQQRKKRTGETGLS